jgi:hypothetical protein
MSMYPGPSSLDCPFSAELDDMMINTRIQGVLSHGANQNFNFGPISLMEGVDSR